MRSMATDNGLGRPSIKKPKLIKGDVSVAANTQGAVVRSQAAARSHNVFRPDIYRVSEGYLN